MTRRASTIVGLALISACGDAARTTLPHPPIGRDEVHGEPALRTCGGPTPETGPGTVREVDWCNRVYEDDGAGKLLVGGMFEEHVWTCNLTGTSEDFGGHTTERLELDAVAYGDLDQDGIEDAVVTLASDWLGCGDLRAGGRGLTRTSTIQAFTVRDGAVVPIAKKLWAHRVPSPSLAIADGEVQRTYLLENGHDCVERWRLSSEALTPVASCRL